MTSLGKTLHLTSLAFLSVCLAGFAAAQDVIVSGDWVKLGDVAPVTGSAADRPIAASPLPGQRMPLSADFIAAQAQAAGYPVNLQSDVWVTRSAGLVEVKSPQPPTDQAGMIPVLNTSVRRGEPITPDMISFEKPDEKRRIAGLITSASLLEDTEATRTLRAGQPLALRDIKAVSIVRKGDPIKLVYQAGPLLLSVSAKALTSAAEGETVRVQNLQSNRTMEAIAYAPGEARVS